MGQNDIPAGTLTLMVLRTLEQMGPQHGYGIARRIEQVSGDRLQLNQGTIYPALLQLEQRGWIRASWASPRTTAVRASTRLRGRDAGGSLKKKRGGASRRRRF